MVALEFEFLNALPQFPDLGFLRAVKQNILRRIVEVQLAENRSLRIVEVPALSLDCAPRLAGILLLPFRDDKIVGVNFKEALEDQREALGGRLLQGENLDVVVVKS